MSKMWRIHTKDGMWLGDYAGPTPVHALVSRHKQDGYPRISVSRGQIVWPSKATEITCGGVDRYDITPVPKDDYRTHRMG